MSPDEAACPSCSIIASAGISMSSQVGSRRLLPGCGCSLTACTGLDSLNRTLILGEVIGESVARNKNIMRAIFPSGNGASAILSLRSIGRGESRNEAFVAKCVYCGRDTKLYENDIPICPQCCEERDAKQKQNDKPPPEC